MHRMRIKVYDFKLDKWVWMICECEGWNCECKVEGICEGGDEYEN